MGGPNAVDRPSLVTGMRKRHKDERYSGHSTHTVCSLSVALVVMLMASRLSPAAGERCNMVPYFCALILEMKMETEINVLLPLSSFSRSSNLKEK